MEKLKAKMPKLTDEIRDITKFKDFYQFTFQYSKLVSQRSLTLDTAIGYWKIIFGNSDNRVGTWVSLIYLKKLLIEFYNTIGCT